MTTEVIADYLSGMSSKEIAEAQGKSTRAIQRELKKCGVTRSRSEAFKMAIKQGRMTYDHLRREIKTKDIRKTVNNAMRFRVFSRDNFRCVYCGNGAKDGSRLEVDHIIQLCDGGKHEESNMQTTCRECNSGKYHLNPVNKGKRKVL